MPSPLWCSGKQNMRNQISLTVTSKRSKQSPKAFLKNMSRVLATRILLAAIFCLQTMDIT